MLDSLLGLVLAEEAPAAPAPSEGSGLMGSLPLLLIIFGIFYFLMIRPQSKERRKREDMMKALKKHDQIVTTAGIHGEVVSITESTVTVRVDDGVRLTFDRTAIWQVRKAAGSGGDTPDAEPAESAPREKGRA